MRHYYIIIVHVFIIFICLNLMLLHMFIYPMLRISLLYFKIIFCAKNVRFRKNIFLSLWYYWCLWFAIQRCLAIEIIMVYYKVLILFFEILNLRQQFIISPIIWLLFSLILFWYAFCHFHFYFKLNNYRKCPATTVIKIF